MIQCVDMTQFIIQDLCVNDRSWTPLGKTECDSNVYGIELNTDGFRYCDWIFLTMELHKEEYEKLNKAEVKNPRNIITVLALIECPL